MKRFGLLILVMVFALSVAGCAASGKAPAKAKVVSKQAIQAKKVAQAKVIRVADEKAIKQVFRAKNPGSKIEFDPIMIDSGWATTGLTFIEKKERIPDQAVCILKKNKGKWAVVLRYVEDGPKGPMTAKWCKKIGLPLATAKKIGIQVSG